MSYCRWSSDAYQCDAYVWADVSGGYCTEIARRRRRWKVELPLRVDLPVGAAHSEERTAWATAWAEYYAALGRLCDDESNWDWLEHNEPEGGWTYHHDTAAECADNLERLVALGFNVPQSAIGALRSEEES